MCTFSETFPSNYWIRDCRFLRYREYRFALKARLNLLPVNGHKKKYGAPEPDTHCKLCRGGRLETHEHMLSMCPEIYHV